MAAHRHQGGSNSAVSDIVRQASTVSDVASHSRLTRITTVRHQACMASQQADRQADRRRGNARSFKDPALPLSNCGRSFKTSESVLREVHAT